MSYFKIDSKTNISPFQNTLAYLGGSCIQTILDNPITSYRQLVQQYSKNNKGELVSPKDAVSEANKVFRNNPVTSSMSGLFPRLIGILLKRIPKFGLLFGFNSSTSNKSEPTFLAATFASIASAPFINPIRVIEKQQRVDLNKTGKEKPIIEILRECKEKNFKPLFRGTTILMGHSFISASLGLVGQVKLQKYIQKQIDDTSKFTRSTSNLISSAIVSPIYVIATNPLSRLEVIMQTNSIKDESIKITEAIKELVLDTKKFKLQGFMRGNSLGIAKAILSLSLFHEGRLFMQDRFIEYNNV